MNEEFVLVNTFFLVALFDARDSLHQRAEEIEKELASVKLIFTRLVPIFWILCELLEKLKI